MNPQLSAVIVAAGRSRRMGFDKLLSPLLGRPLLITTIERLSRASSVGEIILVVRPDQENEIRLLLQESLPDLRVIYVHGGVERQDSVQNGLRAVSPHYNYVLIQDAARPFITPELIDLVYNGAREVGAAVCGNACSDTLKAVDEHGQVQRTVERAGIWAVQTPQIFRKSLLADAYAAVHAAGKIVTDDTAAVEFAGHPVRVVSYAGPNLKVTTPTDWKIAEVLLSTN